MLILCMYVCICMCIYIYMYIYMHILHERYHLIIYSVPVVRDLCCGILLFCYHATVIGCVL